MGLVVMVCYSQLLASGILFREEQYHVDGLFFVFPISCLLFSFPSPLCCILSAHVKAFIILNLYFSTLCHCVRLVNISFCIEHLLVTIIYKKLQFYPANISKSKCKKNEKQTPGQLERHAVKTKPRKKTFQTTQNKLKKTSRLYNLSLETL